MQDREMEISVADLQRDYEPVKADGHTETGAAVVTYRHRHTGALLHIGRPAFSERTIDARLAALRTLLASVESMANNEERSAQINKLRDCARVLVAETQGAASGPLMMEGIAARLARRWTEAERVFRTVTDLWPAEVDGWLELTWALDRLTDQKRRWLPLGVRQNFARTVPPRSAISPGALVQNGLAKEALPVIRRALELDPSDRTNQQIGRHAEQSAAMPESDLEPTRTTPWYKRWFG
jgi:hypothetical protein